MLTEVHLKLIEVDWNDLWVTEPPTSLTLMARRLCPRDVQMLRHTEIAFKSADSSFVLFVNFSHLYEGSIVAALCIFTVFADRSRVRAQLTLYTPQQKLWLWKKNNNTEKTVCELHVLPFACRREARGEGGGGGRTESGSQTITDTYAGKGCGGEEVTPKWANYFALPFQKNLKFPPLFKRLLFFLYS